MASIQPQTRKEFNVHESKPCHPTLKSMKQLLTSTLELCIAIQVCLDSPGREVLSKERARPKELRLWERKVFNARMEKCISSSPVLLPLQSGDHCLVTGKGGQVDWCVFSYLRGWHGDGCMGGGLCLRFAFYIVTGKMSLKGC